MQSWKHPTPGLQESFVQALPSSQSKQTSTAEMKKTDQSKMKNWMIFELNLQT